MKADRTKYANEQYSADDFFYFSYLQSARDGAETQKKIAAVTENAAASQEEKIVKIARSFSAADDQARVMTPEKARLGGSDYIVVGRPITQAADPVAAYRRCVKEFLGE